MGFPRQDYGSGLPFPSPRDLPDPGIKLKSPVTPALQADSLLMSHQGSLESLWLVLYSQSETSPFYGLGMRKLQCILKLPHTHTHTHTLSCKGGWEMYSVAEYLLQAKAQGNSFTIR